MKKVFTILALLTSLSALAETRLDRAERLGSESIRCMALAKHANKSEFEKVRIFGAASTFIKVWAADSEAGKRHTFEQLRLARLDPASVLFGIIVNSTETQVDAELDAQLSNNFDFYDQKTELRKILANNQFTKENCARFT